jgi:murein DD-endopeptidase MepM/ murein hydrolase activator NlpD
MKTDSMERELKSRDSYISNIRNIINGKPDQQQLKTNRAEGKNKYDTIHRLYKSPADAELRSMIESQDEYSLNNDQRNADLNTFLFFPPAKGTITSTFDPAKKHFGIDIVAAPNEAIKATLDGTIIFSDFTSETGYVIGIQHADNLVSIYKHNSALLKKSGEFVKAGDVIAIIGNSGELTEGTHLHFELWQNGIPINPQQFVSF